MLLQNIIKTTRWCCLKPHSYLSLIRKVHDEKDSPINKSFRVLKSDIKKLFQTSSMKEVKGTNTNLSNFETHCDILIIGGGAVGSSIAYWLKEKTRSGLKVVVVEKDPTYTKASTVLSVGGLRQQFSLPENIQMSLFGADFFRTIESTLGDIGLNFTPYGYLTLANEKSAETLIRNSKIQNELGARNEILTAARLSERFPWLNTKDIALGCHGLEKEGWFDPWALLMGFKRKSQQLGAIYTDGEVISLEIGEHSGQGGQGFVEEDNYNALTRANIKLSNGETRTIKFAIAIIAAGANSGNVARLAQIGLGGGLLQSPLPVEPRKRYVYVIQSQGNDLPGLQTPLTIDPNGTYFRRDGLGGRFLCGRSPSKECEPSVDNLDVDPDFFTNEVWPSLAHRVNAFESAKVVGSWAGFYEYNTFDENGIIGPHPYFNNLYIATGFSGHGIQQSPAVGRAISELIIDGQFRTIDLTRLGFDRILVNCPMFETNIV